MKRLMLFFVVLSILMVQTMAFAEYGSYFDVMGDVQKILGSTVDDAWNQNYGEMLLKALSLEGYYYETDDGNIYCTKDHYTGNYNLEIYFKNNKPVGVNVRLTSGNISYLNYTETSESVPVADQFFDRMSQYGLLNDMRENSETYDNIFVDSIVVPNSPVVAVGENSFLQVGFIPQNGNNSFGLDFIVLSREAIENGLSAAAEDISEEPEVSESDSEGQISENDDSSENVAASEDAAEELESNETYTENCSNERLTSDWNSPIIYTCVVTNSNGVEAVDPKKGYSHKVTILEQDKKQLNSWVETETSYYNPDETPAVLKDGTSSRTIEREYDGVWETETWCYFDKDKNPFMNPESGVFCYSYIDAKDGSEFITRYIGVDNQPISRQDFGYASVHSYYTDEDVTRIDYLGVNDELVPVKGEGYCTIIYHKDRAGNNKVIAYLDVDGNRVDVR